MTKKIIQTNKAPAAIGAYSQAVQYGDTLYISGQIPLDPVSMQVLSQDFREQAQQVFRNIVAIADQANTSLNHALKLTVYLTDLSDFAVLNEVMAEFCEEPFPARAAVQVAALPKDVKIEIESVLCVTN